VLISVHMPKTAGTSFTESLRGHFGDRLHLAYADRPLHRPAWRRNLQAATRALAQAASPHVGAKCACVHGHFLPLAYRWVRAPAPVRFVTWMRNPVERLVSHYEHWRREAPPPNTDLLHRRMLDEDWSLETFAFRPELRDVYSVFLWGFPVNRLDFIGITEHYDDELAYFGRTFLGADLEGATKRRNPARSGSRYAIETPLRQRIEAFHARDTQLYRQALALRDKRCS